MEITLTIPDEVAPDLQNGGLQSLSRRALELLALDGYRSGELTEHQVRLMLGFDDRFEVDVFLKKHGAYYEQTALDLEKSRASLDELLNRANR